MEDIKDIHEDDIDMLSCAVTDHFKTPYSLKEYRSVGLDETYVLHLSTSTNGRIVAGLSNNSFVVYDGPALNKLRTEKLKSNIVNVRFSPLNPELVYVGTPQQVQLMDLRSKNGPVSQFDLKENEANGHKVKPFTCFDVNNQDTYLTAGTEVVSHDAYLLFWDVRKSGSLLGGYWETFGDDLTVTKFKETDKLVAASSDGQVNVFDISQESEDDALVTSLNTEAPVRSVTCLPDDKLAIILDHEEALLWKTQDSEPFKTISREDFTVAIKRKITPWTYVGGCHYDPILDKTYFLSGSSFSANPCTRVLTLNSKNKLKAFADLPSSKKAKNTLVRCSDIVNASNNDGRTIFVTGSEDGNVCIWSSQEGDDAEKMASDGAQLKAKSKQKKTGKKPYEDS